MKQHGYNWAFAPVVSTKYNRLLTSTVVDVFCIECNLFWARHDMEHLGPDFSCRAKYAVVVWWHHRPPCELGTIMLCFAYNQGPICYFIAVIPTSWLLDTKGLRLVCLGGSILVFLGCAVRCFSTRGLACTILAHLGQIFNGLAGPVAMAAAPVLSATWFPAHERTTATAIMSMSNNLGVALSVIIGPILVPESDDFSRTSSRVSFSSSAHFSYLFICGDHSDLLRSFFYAPLLTSQTSPRMLQRYLLPRPEWTFLEACDS